MTQFENDTWQLVARLEHDFALDNAAALKLALAVRFQYPTQRIDDDLLHEFVAEQQSKAGAAQ